MLLLIFVCSAYAEDFIYTMKADTLTPYVKEAVLLSVDLKQSNPDVVLLFSFDLKKSPDYRFQRIDSKETDTHHDAKVHYLYLLYPLRPGKINIHFILIKKVTTDESVAYSFSGDRDNVKGLVTKDTKVTLPPLSLQVKALPQGTELVGDFTLKRQIRKTEAAAYEPLPLQITLQGKGYLPLLPSLLPDDLNVTIFSEKPIIKAQQSKEGTESTVTYPMALSHAESFDLPPFKIRAFDPKKEDSYTLSLPRQHFSIRKPDTASLVDSSDSPKPIQNDWSWLATLFSYIIVFAAGYLSAVTLKRGKQTFSSDKDPLYKKVEACRDAKSLLQLLMAQQERTFASSVEKLEKGIYGKERFDFKEIKQEVLEQLT